MVKIFVFSQRFVTDPLLVFCGAPFAKHRDTAIKLSRGMCISLVT